MQGWTLRSVPKQLCEALIVSGQLERSSASWRVAAAVSEDARHSRGTRGGHTRVGGSTAGVASQRRTTDVEFALVGHQESWRAAADVLALLRGREHPPLPDDEIEDIFPWIPPRAVCRVEVRSIVGAKARGLYIDSFIPPDRLEAAYVHDNITRVRGAAAYAIKAGAKIVSLGGFCFPLFSGAFFPPSEKERLLFKMPRSGKHRTRLTLP